MARDSKRRKIIRAQRAARFVDSNLDYMTFRDQAGNRLNPETGQIIPEDQDPGREKVTRKVAGQSQPKADVPRVLR